MGDDVRDPPSSQAWLYWLVGAALATMSSTAFVLSHALSDIAKRECACEVKP